ncbi:ACT domain-containing protein [Svornostia abyssi]|uniref:ACT domain-containing protein n=1 Tax=Svornostia abyssi TaxID=2898438 RepID=A0ABY5PH62_9ACTN|nr:ACT domain-containing protein [Parviterribacteraceae bacterium J379]
MAGEHDLRTLIRSMDPVLRPGSFAVALVRDERAMRGIVPDATIQEDEGLTVILPRERADALGLPYDFVAAWITLRVHSALEAVGLTAAFSTALAEADLSCNVLAGFHHDHLLVPYERRDEAMDVLRALARSGTDAP